VLHQTRARQDGSPVSDDDLRFQSLSTDEDDIDPMSHFATRMDRHHGIRTATLMVAQAQTNATTCMSCRDPSLIVPSTRLD
jgi:hypothetical protein